MSAWHVAPGHHPGILEIVGPSFKISVITEAFDLTPEQSAQRVADAHILAAAQDMLSAARAAIAYDAAIQSCADDPERMSSFCTAQGENLDLLYSKWIDSARAAIAKAVP